jgi:hypothetical protein
LKILQNPIAVTILAVAAAALVFKQIAWPILQRSQWMRHAPAAAASLGAVASTSATPPELAKTTSSPVETANAAPETPIDQSAAETSAARAAGTPRRDPFQSKLHSTNQGKAYPPAREMLTFSGFWRQTGSTLAVINDQVIEVGDSILAYKVEAIDRDRIRVTGPNGRETVEFGTTPPAPSANPQTNDMPPVNTNQ